MNEPSAPTVLVVHNAASDPVGRLGEWLSSAGVTLEVLDGENLPENLDSYAGLVVMGGPMSATDDAVAPWLPAIRALLREAVRREVPTLGVCLGAQLLAVAHGGTVVANPEGPELGWQLVAKRPTAAADDPLFASLPITPDVIQWHYDAIRVLPPGAIHLAASPVCENQAFRIGRLAWGVQFHIETTPEVVRAWARSDAQQLDEFDLDLIVSRADAAHDDVAEVWRPFAEAFAGIVQDPQSVPGNPAGPVDGAAALRASLAAEASAARAPMPMPMPTMRPPWLDGHE